MLRSKLRSAMTHVSLRHSSRRAIFAIPSLLSDLRSLRHLSLSSTHTLKPRDWPQLLRSWAPTIETLCLGWYGAKTAFNDPLSVDNSSIELKSSINSSSPTNLTDCAPPKWIDLGAIFPSLTRLELPSQTLYIHEFAGLPSTLKELQVYGLEDPNRARSLLLRFHRPRPISLASYAMRQLPRSLERLETIVGWQMTYDEWKDIPPNLRFIQTHAVPLDSLTVESIPATISFGSMQDDWRQNSADRRSLRVDRYSISAINVKSPSQRMASIPRNVLRLDLSFKNENDFFPMTPCVISELPTTLTTLKLVSYTNLFADLHSQDIDASSLWPQTLQTFVVGPMCLPKDMKLMPSSITSLKMVFKYQDNLKKVMTLDGNYFPPKLVDCCLGVRDVTCSLCIIGTLPASLKRLFQTDPFHSHRFLHTRETIEEKIPSSLTELTFAMVHDPSPDDRSWVIPSQLVSLIMSQWPVQWLAALPRRLSYLSISRLIGLDEALPSEPLDLFKPLPTSLTSLSLYVSSSSTGFQGQLSTRSLASLTHLRALQFSKTLSFSSSIFRDLPKSLRNLQIGLKSDDPKDAPFLPPTLRKCILHGNIDWHTTLLTEYWPPQAELQGFQEDEEEYF